MSLCLGVSFLSLIVASSAQASPSPEVFSPPPEETLEASEVTFHWSDGSLNVTGWQLAIGSEAGASEYGYYEADPGVTFLTASSLPTSGEDLFVTLSWTRVGATESEQSTVPYTAATLSQVSAGAIWVTVSDFTNRDHRLMRFDLETGEFTDEWQFDYGQVPMGLAIGPSPIQANLAIEPAPPANVYLGVADSGTNFYLRSSIKRIGLDFTFTDVGRFFPQPSDIVVDDDGNIIMLNTSAVSRLTPEGIFSYNPFSAFSGGGAEIVRDVSGNFYISKSNELVQLSADGATATVIPGGATLDVMATNAAGDLFGNESRSSPHLGKLNLDGSFEIQLAQMG